MLDLRFVFLHNYEHGKFMENLEYSQISGGAIDEFISDIFGS